MTLQERLLEFIAYQKMSVSKFESSVGLCNGYIRGIKDVIGSDKLARILQTYPKLNSSWLLFEIGPMLNDSDISSFQSINNYQSGLNSFVANNGIDKLLEEMQNKDKQIDRMLKLLEHIVYKNDGQF